MSSRLRRTVRRAASRVPAYRVLPGGPARDAAALTYLAEHATAEETCAYVERSGRLPIAAASTATLAAKAAFTTQRDELAIEILTGAIDRFPEVSELHSLLSELLTYRGDYEAAANHGRTAWLLDPASPEAARRAVRASYLTGRIDAADREAVRAVARFPAQSNVLWAAATECRTTQQLERLTRAWERGVQEPRQLRPGIRPIAAAAARAGEIDTAIEILAEGILLLVEGIGSRAAVPSRQLHGKGAWGAIEDCIEAMDAAGIPFFFAAGTTLGLIREGRPLGHDSDIDAGVFAGDWDRDALVSAFAKHPRFTPAEVHPDSEKIGLKHRGGSPIDVFRFYEEGGKVWHDGTFVRWHNSPFDVRHRHVGDLSVPLPADDDRYLTENYGDWRTPNPDFDAFVEAPNVEVTWPAYHDCHLARRAYARLSTDDLDGAVADLAAIRERLTASAAGVEVAKVLAL